MHFSRTVPPWITMLANMHVWLARDYLSYDKTFSRASERASG